MCKDVQREGRTYAYREHTATTLSGRQAGHVSRDPLAEVSQRECKWVRNNSRTSRRADGHTTSLLVSEVECEGSSNFRWAEGMPVRGLEDRKADKDCSRGVETDDQALSCRLAWISVEHRPAQTQGRRQ